MLWFIIWVIFSIILISIGIYTGRNFYSYKLLDNKEKIDDLQALYVKFNSYIKYRTQKKFDELILLINKNRSNISLPINVEIRGPINMVVMKLNNLTELFDFLITTKSLPYEYEIYINSCLFFLIEELVEDSKNIVRIQNQFFNQYKLLKQGIKIFLSDFSLSKKRTLLPTLLLVIDAIAAICTIFTTFFK